MELSYKVKFYLSFFVSKTALLFNNIKRKINYVDIGCHMKLITPFRILNQNFHKMELIRELIKYGRLATKRLHEDYRKMYKKHQLTP